MKAVNGQVIDDNGSIKATYRVATDGSYVVQIIGLAATIQMTPERFKQFISK